MANSTTQLMEQFKEGKYRDLLKDIYADEGMLAYQEERYEII